MRTNLKESEAKHWATIAAAHPKTPLVWVVMFIDGPLGSCNDPKTGEPSPADWSYDFIRILSYLLGHGAQLVYTADDSSNPAVDDSYGGYVWPQPGPGMFANLLLAIIPPRGMSRVHCLGKGGNDGRRYMMEHAIELLKQQGHDGDPAKICMVGDRFDTDIRGGRMVGVCTCLVETGAHSFGLQAEYPRDTPTYVARSLGAMHGLKSSPQLELPMVLRQPLRLWVLSHGNVITANAVVKGASLKLDECLKEFYTREAVVSGGFGRRALLKALDEIGLEVSEHQVDVCLAGLLRGTPGGSIPYQLFAQLIRQALRSVGVDAQPTGRGAGASRLRNGYMPISGAPLSARGGGPVQPPAVLRAARPPPPAAAAAAAAPLSAPSRVVRASGGGGFPAAAEAMAAATTASSSVSASASSTNAAESDSASASASASGSLDECSSNASYSGVVDPPSDGEARGSEPQSSRDGSLRGLRGGRRGSVVAASAARAAEKQAEQAAQQRSLSESAETEPSVGFSRRRGSGTMPPSLDLGAVQRAPNAANVSPDAEVSLRAVLRRRQSMGVGSLHLHPWDPPGGSAVAGGSARVGGRDAPPVARRSSSCTSLTGIRRGSAVKGATTLDVEMSGGHTSTEKGSERGGGDLGEASFPTRPGGRRMSLPTPVYGFAPDGECEVPLLHRCETTD